MLNVHRLVQDVARWPLTADTETGYVAVWAGHLRRLCPDPEDHANFSWYAMAAAHLLALTDAAASLHATPAALAEVANQAGISLRLQASYTTARILLERALTINEAVYGSDHPQVAATLTNLGVAHHELGDNPRAVALYQRARIYRLIILRLARTPANTNGGKTSVRIKMGPMFWRGILRCVSSTQSSGSRNGGVLT